MSSTCVIIDFQVATLKKKMAQRDLILKYFLQLNPRYYHGDMHLASGAVCGGFSLFFCAGLLKPSDTPHLGASQLGAATCRGGDHCVGG